MHLSSMSDRVYGAGGGGISKETQDNALQCGERFKINSKGDHVFIQSFGAARVWVAAGFQRNSMLREDDLTFRLGLTNRSRGRATAK